MLLNIHLQASKDILIEIIPFITYIHSIHDVHCNVYTCPPNTYRFHVSGLTPGQDYLITVTAVNAKGESPPEEIDAVRLKVSPRS